VQARACKILLYKCKKCKEKFASKGELRKHKLTHKPLRRISCPARIACKRKFAAPSSLLNHLESGCCHSGMTREKMLEMVLQHDQNRYITNVEASGVASPVMQESSRYFPVFRLQGFQLTAKVHHPTQYPL
jgi:hypothetical protein